MSLEGWPGGKAFLQKGFPPAILSSLYGPIMLQALTRSHCAALRRIFPEGDCLFSPEQLLPFHADASRLSSPPLAVVRPTGVEQCQEFMAWALAEDVPVFSRARATNVVGACVPKPSGVVVSTLKMNRILDIDPEDFVVVTQPGVITADLQARVEEKNLFYPPDPASMRSSTIGGNVSTCAGGMRALKYGVTRDYVLALEAVLPGGKVIRPGRRTHKNVVGLDLVRLLTGSEGTLALLTEITLKLLPLPERTASLLLGFSDFHNALEAARNIFAAGILPTALEFMAEEILKCLDEAPTVPDVPWPKSTKAALLIKLDGSQETIGPAMARLENAVKSAAPIYQAMGGVEGGEDEESLWELRRLINPASFHVAPDKINDDVTVPRGKVIPAIEAFREISRRTGLTIMPFGHLGDGNIHVNIMYDAKDGKQLRNALQAKKDVLDAVLKLGGSMSGEHGVGLTKGPYIHKQLSEEERNIMRSIKAAFDPTGIMNPGKGF